ncbi:hypothetical protein BJ165DRAFT_1398843 [Panaeolus papilionaceus]|nr:hypothetical protein BJ165DRAFT_1398843 [Panaeolus papilionaceus]
MLSWLSNKPSASSGEPIDEPQTQTGTSNPPSRTQTRSPRTSLSPTYANPYNYAGHQSYTPEGQSNAYSTGVMSRPSGGETPVYGSSSNIKAAKKDRDREKGKEKEKERERELGPFGSLTTPHDAFIADLYGLNTANTSTAALQTAPLAGGSDSRKVSADQESLAWESSLPSSPPRLGIVPPSALNTGLSIGTATATAPAIATSLSSSRNELVPPAVGVISSGASYLSATTTGTARLATPVDLLTDPYDGSVLGSLMPHLPEHEDEHGDDLHTMALAGAGVPGARAPSELVWSHLSRVLDLQNDISRLHMRMENIGTGKDGTSAKKGGKKGHHRTPSGRAGTKPDFGLGGDADSLKTPGGTDKIPLSVDTPTLARSMGLRGKEKDPYASSLPRGMRRQRGMSTVSDVSEHSSDADDVGNVSNTMDDGGLDMPTEEAEAKRLREEEFAKLASQFEGRKEAIHEIMDKVDSLSKAITDFHKLHFGFPNVPQPSMTGLAAPAPPITESLSDTTHFKSSTSRNPATQYSDPMPGASISGFKPMASSPDRPPAIPKTAPAHIQINPMVMGRARSDGAAMGTPVLPPVPFTMPKSGGVDRPERVVEAEAAQTTAESNQHPGQQAQTQTDQQQQGNEGQSHSERIRERKKAVPMLLINSLELDSNLSRQEHLMDSPASTLGSLKLQADD